MKMKEEKNKSNLWFMLLVLLLISAIMCISSFGIVTWARYRTVIGGNVEAQIAKWSFKVNGEEEQFADINLADTIAFEHVEKTKVAPGTYGAFDLIIDASGSEVSLDYYIDIELTQKPTNLKFYSDAQYANEIIPNAENKVLAEGEILLPNIAIPVTKTLYWKWEYRTSTMPPQEVLNGYINEIQGLEGLINEYNTDGKTDEEKAEIARKINDKIDTYEEGGDVILPITVKGVQKYTGEFSAKGAIITSDTSKEYDKDDEIDFSIEFTESVFADANQTPITNANAPVVTVDFQTQTTVNSPIAKVASLIDTQINLAEASGKVATFVNAERNKLNYKYIVQKGEKGIFKIDGISGSVFNKSGDEIQFDNTSTIEIKGNTLVVNTALVLEVGSTVYYAPTGVYTLDKSYAQSGTTYSTNIPADTGTKTYYNSGSNRITSWKVLEIDENNNIKLVPTHLNNKVVLMGANGYNNGVKILNDLCRAVYSDFSKNVIARSIRMEDFDNLVKENLKEEYADEVTPYQTSTVYTSTRARYPKIHVQEYHSVINQALNTIGLKQSEYVSDYITGVSSASKNQPYVVNGKNISTNYFEDKYYNLVYFNFSLGYYIASRCIVATNDSNDNLIAYNIRNYDGSNKKIHYQPMYYSDDGKSGYGSNVERYVLPIVELNASQLQENAEGTGFEVK